MAQEERGLCLELCSGPCRPGPCGGCSPGWGSSGSQSRWEMGGQEQGEPAFLPTHAPLRLLPCSGACWRLSWQLQSAGSRFRQSRLCRLPLAPLPALSLQPGPRRPSPRICTLLFAAHLPSLPQRHAGGSPACLSPVHLPAPRHTRVAGLLQPHSAQLRVR